MRAGALTTMRTLAAKRRATVERCRSGANCSSAVGCGRAMKPHSAAERRFAMGRRNAMERHFAVESGKGSVGRSPTEMSNATARSLLPGGPKTRKAAKARRGGGVTTDGRARRSRQSGNPGGIEARPHTGVSVGDAPRWAALCTHTLPEKAARPPEAST
jgi:hypothetical protein